MTQFCRLLLFLFCVACGAEDDETFTVSLAVDGETRAYSYADAISVAEVLAGAQIVLGERDRLSHPLSLAIADGMRLTVRRVVEEITCAREPIPFQRRRMPFEGIPPGEERLRQRGRLGEQEACFRRVLEDEVETSRTLIGPPTIITAPVDEITDIGPTQTAEALAIGGRLSYINKGVAWTIKRDASAKRALQRARQLDGLVFAPNESGTHLMYTAESETGGLFNELWLLDFDSEFLPIKLAPADVLDASWRPGHRSAITYSTGERGQGGEPWIALNNLWHMQIDIATGQALAIREIVAESDGGAFGWRGRVWHWSPDGDRLAWINAKAIGAVDIASGGLHTLLQFAPFSSAGSSVWLPHLSWARDGSAFVATAHGAPLGSESPESSPVFDIVAFGLENSFSAILREAAGMWAAPVFSPRTSVSEDGFDAGMLAWMRARDPYSSLNSEYDLMVADRDGSNQRLVFPGAGQTGIRMGVSQSRSASLAWSPDARHIAFVYKGDLWIVNVRTGDSHQLTFDGGASRPVWTP